MTSAFAKAPVAANPVVTLRQAQGDKESVAQPCHKLSLQTKNARRFRRFVVAPTGIEPLHCGPGRSPALTKTPILSGFRRFTVPSDSDQYRGDSAAP